MSRRAAAHAVVDQYQDATENDRYAGDPGAPSPIGPSRLGADRMQQAEVDAIMQDRIHRRLRTEGVTIVASSAVYIEDGATIGRDTIVYPPAESAPRVVSAVTMKNWWPLL